MEQVSETFFTTMVTLKKINDKDCIFNIKSFLTCNANKFYVQFSNVLNMFS